MLPFAPSTFFHLEGFAHKSLFSSISFVWEALANLPFYFEELSLGRIEGEVSSSAMLIHGDRIHLGKGSKVSPFALIEGPVWIGEDCEIRHGALIRPYSIIGDGCVIGHASEVKHSILLNNAAAAHFNFVGDSILGSGVNMGAGAKCGNLRLDGREVLVRHQDKVFHTKLRKFGAIMGDDTKIGCNVVTNPGAILRKNFLALPNCTVSGVHLDEEEAFVR